MSVEDFLARLYTDADLLRRFLADRAGEARKAGLAEFEIAAMGEADGVGLQMAAASYAHKRDGRSPRRRGLIRAIMRHLRSS
jgi:hypothetical protein